MNCIFLSLIFVLIVIICVIVYFKFNNTCDKFISGELGGGLNSAFVKDKK